jgi:two-component system response regulator YesN
VRITTAKVLLEQSDQSIHEISILVGFSDQNNFIRKFKLMTGATPLQYRNQHQPG